MRAIPVAFAGDGFPARTASREIACARSILRFPSSPENELKRRFSACALHARSARSHSKTPPAFHSSRRARRILHPSLRIPRFERNSDERLDSTHRASSCMSTHWACMLFSCFAKEGRSKFKMKMAERVGFEPTVELPLHSISNAAPSTARPSLRLNARPIQ